MKCPGPEWSLGRGDSIRDAMSKAGSKSKGKSYWYKIDEDGKIIRRRCFESPGDEFFKGYGPKR
jgi:hypothetical protein